jgi:hypothetical protein
MSAPVPLLVPQPALTFKPVSGSFAPLENVVAVAFSAVRFPDGSAMTADDFAGAHALLTRLREPMAAAEVWDAAAKTWRAAGSIEWSVLRGVPLLPPPSGFAPWEGILVGAGQKDAAGMPLLAPSLGGFPRYRLRGAFTAHRGGVAGFGLGPESDALEFAATADSTRFAARMTPDADSATRVQLMLRNAAAQPVGMLDIDASGGSGVVRLQSFTPSGGPLGSVTLQDDGSIRIAPLAGQKIVLAGDVEAERIEYLPLSGLPKKTLN